MPKIDLTESNASHTNLAPIGGNRLNRTLANIPGTDLNTVTQDINSMRTYLQANGYTVAQLDKYLKNDLTRACIKKYGEKNLGSAVTSITLGGTSTAAVAATSQQSATAVKSGGAANEAVTSKATWSSSDPTKATVSTTGLVTGVAAGTTVITAGYGGKSAQKTFTVT